MPERDDSETKSLYYKTLGEINSGLRSAQIILLTVNVICAFLFLMLFEMVFGWQSFRPGASKYIFAENLARLATTNVDTTFSIFDRSVVNLAGQHAQRILAKQNCMTSFQARFNSWGTDILRDSLVHVLNSYEVWKQEELLRVFVSDVESLRRKSGNANAIDSVCVIAKSTAPAVVTVEPVTTDNSHSFKIHVDTMAIALARPGNSVEPKSGAGDDLPRLSSPTISFNLQEIIDRFSVNEETRGRRVGRRQYSFPVIGTLMQVEDISLPVAIFLILLAYWVYTALMRAFDSTKSFLKQLEMSRLKYVSVEESSIPLEYHLLHGLVNRFHFMRMRRIRLSDGRPVAPEAFDPIPDMGFLWLILSPYLVTMSGIMANLHETFLLDVRWHGGAFHFGSSPIRAFFIEYILLVACGVYLARIGFKTGGAFVKVRRKIRDTYSKWSSRSLQRTTNTADIAPSAHEEESEQMTKWYLSPTTFAWIAVSPFVLFGSFSALAVNEGQFLHDYFLKGHWLVVYLLLLSSYALGFKFIMSRRAPITLRYLSVALVFVFLPVAYLISILFVAQLPPAYGYWPIVPSLFATAGIIVIGWSCGVYRLLAGMTGTQSGIGKHW